jgi:hypothetical protein
VPHPRARRHPNAPPDVLARGRTRISSLLVVVEPRPRQRPARPVKKKQAPDRRTPSCSYRVVKSLTSDYSYASWVAGHRTGVHRGRVAPVPRESDNPVSISGVPYRCVEVHTRRQTRRSIACLSWSTAIGMRIPRSNGEWPGVYKNVYRGIMSDRIVRYCSGTNCRFASPPAAFGGNPRADALGTDDRFWRRACNEETIEVRKISIRGRQGCASASGPAALPVRLRSTDR